ncbi:MAG TPA: glycosyltransferase [Bryobacteraceae bacterium]|jgi:glycosyltransferase involved in cell wall biosynthesis
MKITTDIAGLERVAPRNVTVAAIPQSLVASRWKRNLKLFVSALGSHHLVIHFSLPEIIFFSVCLSLAPFRRCRITTLDFFAGDIRPAMRPLVRWSLGRVARFLVYFRDTSVFEQLLGLRRSKFHYIPFKVNALELISGAHQYDGGYIFSGGRSRRDFATLFKAVGNLGYPVKLLTGEEADLTPHGSTLNGLTVPENVELLRNDSSMQSFVQLLAGARLVVIPLLKNTRTQAGIGVYLQAMAARKCVIISSGLGVSDVLTDDLAIIVPAGDAEALQVSVKRAWEDADLRERYAAASARYALALGAEDELRKSVLNALPEN